MAKKDLGYVELEWICPSCGARNKGSNHDCRQCGAEMPDDVHFELPTSAKLDTSAETAETVAAGPDILCPWCGARNPGDADKCSQCGGPLKDGKRRASGDVIGAFKGQIPQSEHTSSRAAPKATNVAAPSPNKSYTGPSVPAAAPSKNRSFKWIVVAILAFMALFAIMMMSLSRGRDTTTATVSSVGWESTIVTQQLVPVQQEGWRDEIPQGSSVSDCTAKVRFTHDEPVPDSVERCGTPYVVDTGTGQGKVQQDCYYDVYDSWCTYQALEWQQGAPIVISGSGYSARWPSMPVGTNFREVSRDQDYYVKLTDGSRTYTYAPRSVSHMTEFQPGSRWEITTNAFGGITDIQPR